MPIEYFKRWSLRREVPTDLAPQILISGYSLCAWQDTNCDHYADVLLKSFAGESDSLIFPNLGSWTGCQMLVHAIQDYSGFCPEATWLIDSPSGPVGAVLTTIQGGEGTIQNLAVIPQARGMGLGTALLIQALTGLASIGITTVELEATVSNCSAMALYRRLGFCAYKTSYRSVEFPDRSMLGLGI